MKFWSVEDLAEYLGVPKTWIYDRTRENGPDMIPHIKLGNSIPSPKHFRIGLRVTRSEGLGPIDPNSVSKSLRMNGEIEGYHGSTTDLS